MTYLSRISYNRRKVPRQRAAAGGEDLGMTIKDLEYFAAIGKHQNIARAARSLYITPQGHS